MTEDQAIIGFIILGTIILCLYFSPEILDFIDKKKQDRKKAKEKAREEAKAQNLPAPAILDIDLVRPTLTVSKFVSTSENVGIKDDRITMGIQQLLQEAFQESDYILTDESDANFTVSAEIVYIGRPNEAFSIVGIFNRRKLKHK